jgi:uncharacterized membrane protein YhaH (DUF805 family)
MIQFLRRIFSFIAYNVCDNWGIGMSLFKLLFSFKGRINRGQYWFAAFLQGIVFTVALGGYLALVGTIFPSDVVKDLEPGSKELAALAPLLLPVLFIVIMMAWMGAAAYTKRLHDRNKGASWLALIYLPSALTLVNPLFVVISLIVGLWMFIELGCLRGTDGPNRFDGPEARAYLDDVFGKAPATLNKPSKPSGEPNLGGMAGAMAAINAAAREKQNQRPTAAASAAPAPQFGQHAPTQFGRLNAGATSGGFGRRGL